MEDSCRDVGVLSTKITALGARQDSIEKFLSSSLTELKDIIKALSNDIKAQMNSLTTQTNNQETRLTIIEAATKSQEERLGSLDGKVDKMSIRMGQIVIIGIVASILLPVVAESFLQRPSEIAPIAPIAPIVGK